MNEIKSGRTFSILFASLNISFVIPVNSVIKVSILNPGFTKDETNIKVENDVIYVSMTSESKEGENDGHKYHVKQWSKSSYQESWNIPDNVIQEQISAKNNDGVLTITLPKKEEDPKKEVNVRTIEIK